MFSISDLLQIEKNSEGSFLLVPFLVSIGSAYSYRFFFIDTNINPGGIFIPTDAYGLADLNTFLVGLACSMLVTLAYNKIVK